MVSGEDSAVVYECVPLVSERYKNILSVFNIRIVLDKDICVFVYYLVLQGSIL